MAIAKLLALTIVLLEIVVFDAEPYNPSMVFELFKFMNLLLTISVLSPIICIAPLEAVTLWSLSSC